MVSTVKIICMCIGTLGILADAILVLLNTRGGGHVISMNPTSSSSQLPGPSSLDPLFDNQHPGDVLLVSSTPVGFYFPASILIDQSSFFRNISELHYTSNDLHPDAKPIHLPTAATAALAYVLCVLKHIIRGEGTLPDLPTENLNDVLICTDAYDLPIVPRLLFNLYGPTLSNPYELFTLAVLSGNEGYTKSSSTGTYKGYMHDMPPWTRRILTRWAPEYFVRLLELHNARLPAHVELRDSMSLDYPGDVMEWDYWERICAQDGGCVTFQRYNGDIRRAAVEATTFCLDGFEDLELLARQDAVIRKLGFRIECLLCCDHFTSLWLNSFKRYYERCPPTIEGVGDLSFH